MLDPFGHSLRVPSMFADALSDVYSPNRSHHSLQWLSRQLDPPSACTKLVCAAPSGSPPSCRSDSSSPDPENNIHKLVQHKYSTKRTNQITFPKEWTTEEASTRVGDLLTNLYYSRNVMITIGPTTILAYNIHGWIWRLEVLHLEDLRND